MSGVDEARLALEKDSVSLPLSEANATRIIELTKSLFSKGYDDIELIGKVEDAQICYINLLDADGAQSYEELREEVKLNLVNTRCVAEDGIVADSATVQATDPKAQEKLVSWVRTESDYFSPAGEEDMAPSQQINVLIEASRTIANVSAKDDKVAFIIRPTILHENLMKAIMEARGVKFERTEK